MTPHGYKLTWTINDELKIATESHPEGVPKEQITEDQGATDALFVASLIFPQDGGLSVYFRSQDGRTNTALTDTDLFKVWSLLAKHLSESQTLAPVWKDTAGASFDLVRTLLSRNQAPLH